MEGTDIPEPSSWLAISSMLASSNSNTSMLELARTYGPVFKISRMPGIPGQPSRVFVCSQEYLDEICDEKRFAKYPNRGGLSEVRNATGSGLFTAFPEEEDWGIAHRVLMPSFGPLAIKSMFDEMCELAFQLVMKWARHGPKHEINVPEDFTRLTLDTIALCTMDTRFNSFYREGLHPFVEAMGEFLEESGYRGSRPAFVTKYFYREATAQYWRNVKIMRDVADDVISERRASSIQKKDLVDVMITGKDPQTGKQMSDASITDNMITFLIAGHETTSGLLSFLFYELLKNPQELKKLQQEVDQVLGSGKIEFAHISKLPYLSAAIREALRLHSPAPGFSVRPVSKNPDDFPLLIGKKGFRIHQNDGCMAFLDAVHRNPETYGEDADMFKPERMLDEHFQKLARSAWKPFGNGARGCIGRAFALQEVHIAVALLLQNFDFHAVDPEYELKLKRTLTIKPANLYMTAKLRPGLEVSTLERRLWGSQPAPETLGALGNGTKEEASSKPRKTRPMRILYGSNTGTCQTLAFGLSSDASVRGYDATVSTLDAGVGKLSKDTPVVVITSSYEGEPPDNAVEFVRWLDGLEDGTLHGIKHAVFGCGNRDWVQTFQRIPNTINSELVRCGSTPIVGQGLSDAADNDTFNDFDRWTTDVLWPAIQEQFPAEQLDVTESSGFDSEVMRHSISFELHQTGQYAVVTRNELLTAPGEPEKRHLEFRLPLDVQYRVGDYLMVVPVNPQALVKKVLARFELAADTRIAVKESQVPGMPSDLTVHALLHSYLELNQVATAKNVEMIATSITSPSEREILHKMQPTIQSGRLTVFDLITSVPSAQISFGDFLSMLPPIRPRQYSISSAPSASNGCSLTLSVLDDMNAATGTHRIGAASNFLAALEPGERVRVSIRSSQQQRFRPPEDPEQIPIVMICVGTGLAPFRGFIQQRMQLAEAGKPLAPALLFVGCRHPDRDLLYRNELADWKTKAGVDVRYAFSQLQDASEGCKYVQDRLWSDRRDVMNMFAKGARAYICGSTKILQAIREVVIKAYVTEKGADVAKAEEWYNKQKGSRVFSDVFA